MCEQWVNLPAVVLAGDASRCVGQSAWRLWQVGPTRPTHAAGAAAAAPGAVLLNLSAQFLLEPPQEHAWTGYKISGIYLALILVAMMADALVPLALRL